MNTFFHLNPSFSLPQINPLRQISPVISKSADQFVYFSGSNASRKISKREIINQAVLASGRIFTEAPAKKLFFIKKILLNTKMLFKWRVPPAFLPNQSVRTAFWIDTTQGPRLISCFHALEDPYATNFEKTIFQFLPNTFDRFDPKKTPLALKVSKIPNGDQWAVSPQKDIAVFELVAPTQYLINNHLPDHITPLLLSYYQDFATNLANTKVYKIGVVNNNHHGWTTNSGRVGQPRLSNEGVELIDVGLQSVSGNSGGPVINKKGQVIGMLTQTIEGGGVSSMLPSGIIQTQLKEWGFIK